MSDSSGIGIFRFLFPNGVFSFSTVVLGFNLAIIYVLLNTIYYVTYHPLANVPGPKLCAISRIPYWRQMMKGNDVQWIHSLHRQYGPMVRFGPTDLSYTTADAWKDIHGREKGKKENGKSQDFSVQPVNGVQSMLTANLEDHDRVRRLFSPAFSERALKAQEPLFKKYVDILLSKLHELGAGGKPVEMSGLYNFATFDTMAELCFGHPLGLLAKNEFSPWVRSIFESLKMLPFASMIAYYPILNALFQRFEPKSVTEQRVTHCRHSEERVNQRLHEGSAQSDIWNLVMTAEDYGRGLSLEEMHSNAELFMLAGSETTATLLSGLTYYLLLNPEKYARLKAEIRGAFTSKNEMTFETLASLKYTNACIKEGLRIYPPVPIGSPRVIPDGGQLILGRYIPAETRVSVHHYSTYHSESNFKNCDSFVPERWIDGERQQMGYDNDVAEAHQPFAWGPRNCLGQSMAMHEMRLILAAVMLEFDMTLCKESENWIQQEAFALWMKKSLMCTLVPTTA